MLLVEKLPRMLFGIRSEKVLHQIEQLEFQLEELHAASAVEELETVTRAACPAAAKLFRRPLPKHLPREVHTHIPAMMRAPTVEEDCANSVKIHPRCWSGCGPTSR
jgi:transposase